MTAPNYIETMDLYMSSYTLKQLRDEVTDFAKKFNADPDLVTLYFGDGEGGAPWIQLLREETPQEKARREAREEKEKQKEKAAKCKKQEKERALYEKLKAKYEK